MQEPSPSASVVKTSCISCLLYAKLALAGDMESTVLIDDLLEKCRGIDWNDPRFIAESERMHGSAPVLPFDTADLPMWRALVHVLTEKLASREETIASLNGALSNAIEREKKYSKIDQELFSFIRKATAINEAMRDRLELLGDDTSAYVFPETPGPLS